VSEPTVTCRTCGRFRIVPTDKGNRYNPVKIAKGKLARTCRENGHEPDIQYRAGIR
jgi:hypothetical protein